MPGQLLLYLLKELTILAFPKMFSRGNSERFNDVLKGKGSWGPEFGDAG